MIEFYSGLGGFSAALGPGHQVMAVDQSPLAARVYRANWSGKVREKTVESMDRQVLERFGAKLWWASPPCQPYTVKGKRRQLKDPRAASFPALMEHLIAVRPTFFAMENVAGFAHSTAHELLLNTLRGGGYQHLWEGQVCPSRLGIPNRRSRFFTVAGRQPFAEPVFTQMPNHRLAEYLDLEASAHYDVPPTMVRRFQGAMDLIEPGESMAITNCFTSGYGKSIVRCGSYLVRPDGRIRYFTPGEVARLLGFGEDLVFPPDISDRQAWKLLGNSLSIPCVRAVLTTLSMG